MICLLPAFLDAILPLTNLDVVVAPEDTSRFATKALSRTSGGFVGELIKFVCIRPVFSASHSRPPTL
jgi:hypothetical protein